MWPDVGIKKHKFIQELPKVANAFLTLPKSLVFQKSLKFTKIWATFGPKFATKNFQKSTNLVALPPTYIQPSIKVNLHLVLTKHSGWHAKYLFFYNRPFWNPMRNVNYNSTSIIRKKRGGWAWDSNPGLQDESIICARWIHWTMTTLFIFGSSILRTELKNDRKISLQGIEHWVASLKFALEHTWNHLNR